MRLLHRVKKMQQLKKARIAIFCIIISIVAIIIACYYFMYLAKSPFYEILEVVKEKKLDIEVCYFDNRTNPLNPAKANILDSIYEYCNGTKKEPNTKTHHHKIPYETYKSALQKANIPKSIPAKNAKPLANNKETIRLSNAVAVFFSKDSTPMYEVRLGVCPKINGQNYEYDEDFYALLESIASIQEPQRAKRILTHKKLDSTYRVFHIKGISCVDSYMTYSEQYCARDKQIQTAEMIYYDCLDFTDIDKEQCKIKRDKNIEFANKKSYKNAQGECLLSLD